MFACLKPCFRLYCDSLLGRTFCKTTVGDSICSLILPCDHAFVQHFQGTLYCACSVLKELVSLNACRVFYETFKFWSVVHCTVLYWCFSFSNYKSHAGFKNIFFKWKKKKQKKEGEMYVANDSVYLVKSLFNIATWTCCVQCVFDAISSFLFILCMDSKELCLLWVR